MKSAKKVTRRFLTLALLAAMCFTVVTACTPDQKTSIGTGGSTGTGGPLLDRPVEEMAGKDFVIIQHSEELQPFEYEENSLNAEKALQRLDEVEQLYGCTLSFNVVPYNTTTFAQAFQELAYVPGSGDLVFASNNGSLRLAIGKGGEESMLEPILQFDNIIDFWNVEKWGNLTAKETMMGNGIFYGVCPAMWIDRLPHPDGIYAYNKVMVEDAGESDLQEYYEQGQWTQRKMVDVIVNCFDDTGSTTIYGLATDLNHLARMTVGAAGGVSVTVNGVRNDGTVDWVNGWTTPTIREALDWLHNFLMEDGMYIEQTSTWTQHNSFIAETAATCLCRPEDIPTIAGSADASFRFGLVPWVGSDPSVISAEYGSVAAVAIPTFAQNPTWSAFLMADLFEGLDEQTRTYDGLVSYYKNNYFEDDLSWQLYSGEIANTPYYNYWPNGGETTLYAVASAVNRFGGAQLQQAYGGMLSQIMEQYILPNKLALAEYETGAAE